MRAASRETAPRRLDLRENGRIGDEGVGHLSSILLDADLNCDLDDLDLSRCGLSAKGAKAASRLIGRGDATGLKRLSLSSNKIGDGGALALAERLEFGHLETLIAIRCHVGPRGGLAPGWETVSYTHLTLPTILRV